MNAEEDEDTARHEGLVSSYVRGAVRLAAIVRGHTSCVRLKFALRAFDVPRAYLLSSRRPWHHVLERATCSTIVDIWVEQHPHPFDQQKLRQRRPRHSCPIDRDLNGGKNVVANTQCASRVRRDSCADAVTKLNCMQQVRDGRQRAAITT